VLIDEGKPRIGSSVRDSWSVDFDGAVIVAVRAVGVMEVAAHDVVRVISVRDGVVTARFAVDVAGVVALAVMGRRAGGRVRCADGERVLVDMIAVHVMQMAVVQVVGVPVMLDRLVAAARAVRVVVALVLYVITHRFRPPVV
jgi:hypothetical protein